MAFRVSEPKWVGVWHARDSSGIKWAYRRSAIYPAVLVELARQHRLKVMARKFRFRPIDNADRALQSWHKYLPAEFLILTQRQQTPDSWHWRFLGLPWNPRFRFAL